MFALTLSSQALAVEGATPAAEPSPAPSTTLRAVPLPRFPREEC